MSAMGAPPLAPTQEVLALFAGDGGNSGSMPRRNNESANSLASLEETQRALVAPRPPPSEGAWEAPALGDNVAGVFARAPASPMHVEPGPPPAPRRPLGCRRSLAPARRRDGRSGRRRRRAPGTRHASGATGAAHDDAGPEPPPPPFGVARPVKAQRPRPSPLSAGHDGLVRDNENHSPSGARKN